MFRVAVFILIKTGTNRDVLPWVEQTIFHVIEYYSITIIIWMILQRIIINKNIQSQKATKYIII